eukprot:m.177728 g.177728  ORF g.177728 m.177728 type:complete len:492 (-) comp31908_c0_seq1:124-1599(-)
MASASLESYKGFGIGIGIGIAIGVTGYTLWYQYSESYSTTKEGNHEDPTLSTASVASRHRLAKAADNAGDEELLQEQLSRSSLFFGEQGQGAVASAFVIVVGVGGVGSHASHMLARSGVKRLRLVDFDNVSLSSLNRHAVATRDDVGRPKVEVCADRYRDFMPTCTIDSRDTLFNKDNADELLSGNPDYVIDAIDDIPTKADLIEACARLNIKVITALAAGAKCDPTKIVIGDIMDTTNDALGIKLRSELRNRNFKLFDATKGGSVVKAVYSYEKPSTALAPLNKEQMENPDKYGAIGGMRIRVVPVVGTQPAIFGMYLAITVLSDLAGKTFDPSKVEPISKTFAAKQSDRLKAREKREFLNIPNNDDYSPVADNNECAYVIEQLWRSKSTYNFARVESRQPFELTRFDRSKPALPYNLVFLTRVEAEAHDASTKLTGNVPIEMSPSSQASSQTNTDKTGAQKMPSRQRLLEVQRTLVEHERFWISQSTEH